MFSFSHSFVCQWLMQRKMGAAKYNTFRFWLCFASSFQSQNKVRKAFANTGTVSPKQQCQKRRKRRKMREWHRWIDSMLSSAIPNDPTSFFCMRTCVHVLCMHDTFMFWFIFGSSDCGRRKFHAPVFGSAVLFQKHTNCSSQFSMETSMWIDDLIK